MHSYILELKCSRCGRKYDANVVQSVCTSCGGTLFSMYDIEKAKNKFAKQDLQKRTPSLWRYREMLPVKIEKNIVTLGEGYTPITRIERIGEKLGLKQLYVKDDGIIPTGTFKTRGMTTAISKVKELGISKVALASAGNAGGAAATYSARAGIECFVFMPKDAPESTKKECYEMGAHVYLVDGLINDAGKFVVNGKQKYGWFELSTLKEPYRVEGKKTMGYEIAEQFDWILPDVIVYPTGGGTGLVGMWKAFNELQELGWLDRENKKPRMVSVQSKGCAPVVKAFKEGKESVEEPFKDAQTIAGGIRVPSPYASEQILKVIRASQGTAVEVDDSEIIQSMQTLGKQEGLNVCPEGAATLAGLGKLIDNGWLEKNERVLLYNTGSGLKYPEVVNLPKLKVFSKEVAYSFEL
ncbi:MAG: threonine synthase [archaeon]|nr:threonine synthase [archaeon]